MIANLDTLLIALYAATCSRPQPQRARCGSFPLLIRAGHPRSSAPARSAPHSHAPDG